MARHSFIACLRRWGWQRDDGPADEVGECIDESGCPRPGRWTHQFVVGGYCAQHAHMFHRPYWGWEHVV